MSKFKPITDREMHENWIRSQALELALSFKKENISRDDVLENAAVFTQFITNKNDAEIVSLVQDETT